MSWTNVPTKNPGDPVTAENWNGLVGNPTALAEGEPGAPRVRIPQAVRTDELDPAKVLRPDGAGGVLWGSILAELSAGIHLALDGGEPVTAVPANRLIYAIHGTVNNTAYHYVDLPDPAQCAGHLVTVAIEQPGSFGGSRIRSGGSILAQWIAGDTYTGLFTCDGAHWFYVAGTFYHPEAP